MPTESDETHSASPGDVGATTAIAVDEYVQSLTPPAGHVSPPNTDTPSALALIARASGYVAPHAYTRFDVRPATAAIRLPIVANGAARVPAFVSLPAGAGATNTPNESSITHGFWSGVAVAGQADASPSALEASPPSSPLPCASLPASLPFPESIPEETTSESRPPSSTGGTHSLKSHGSAASPPHAANAAPIAPAHATASPAPPSLHAAEPRRIVRIITVDPRR